MSVIPRGEGGLISKTGGCIGVDEEISGEIVNRIIVSEIDSQRTGAGDSADGDGIDRSIDLGDLHRCRRDGTGGGHGKVGGIDTAHWFTKRGGETDATC